MTELFCPSPLVAALESAYTTLWVYQDCVIPCPTIETSKHEWEELQFTLTLTSIFTMSISFVMLVSHAVDLNKHFNRVMLMMGFFTNSVVLTAFFLSNTNNSLVCDGDAHYIEKGYFCVFQASVLIFTFIWVEVWSFIFTFDTYLHVTSQMKYTDMSLLRWKYVTITFGVSALATAIPLLAGNLGFDPKQSLPICLFLFSDNSLYFWSLMFFPILFLRLATVCLTIAWMISMHEIFVSPNLNKANSSQFLRPDDSAHSGFSVEDWLEQDARSVDTSVIPESNDELAQLLLRHGGAVCSSDEHEPDDRPFSSSSSYNTSTMSSNNFLASVGLPWGQPVYRDAAYYLPPDEFSNGKTASTSDSFNNSSGIDKSSSGRVGSTSTLGGKNLLFVTETWKYSGLPILFLVIFCALSLAIAPVLFYLNYWTYQDNVDGVSAFAECLMHASLSCVDQTQAGVDACGLSACGRRPHPRPNDGLVYFLLLWLSGYGILPFLTFGFGGLFGSVSDNVMSCIQSCRIRCFGESSEIDRKVSENSGSFSPIGI